MAFSENEFVAGANQAFLQDTEVPPSSSGFLNTKGQILHAPPPCQLPAGLPRLGYLDQCFTDLKHVSDADITF
jgi:hypothetical protein